MMSVEPFTGRAVDAAVRVIDEPDGARSGTFSHAAASAATIARSRKGERRQRRDTMKPINILVPMKLAGQARDADRGYAMAALLVAMSMMAIMMTVAMPVWKQTAQREKETELIFRGTQYVHAIALFQRKTANAFPPSIDLLVDQRFLRKKYKDPITGGDFQILTAAQQGANSAAGPGQRGGQAAPGTGAGAGATTTPGATGGATGGRATAPIGTSPIGAAGVAAAGGIMGVASKSKDKSLRIYNGRTHYNEWAFLYSSPVQ